ncbi:MAG TPA: polymer-forming cytoskeletal protein [Polyangiaceae bacterium]|nr:polymer-forming cytoskeletal protein [Polyangiaceae bacterium]
MARHSADASVLGRSTRVTGRITGEGAVRVEGNLRGDISVTGEAEITEGGSVEGNVSAESLDVSGSLLGNATVKGPVAIHGSAIVRGELRGSEISIEPGSRVSVRLDTDFELDLAAVAKRR